MSVTIPDSHRDLLDEPVYAVLTTMMPDGQPQSTVVWVDYDGTYVRVNSAKGRQKDKNMRANPRVSVVTIDPQDPYRWLEVRGIVEVIDEENGVAHIDKLANKYAGATRYYGDYAPAERAQQETRVMYKIRPTRVTIYPARR